MWETVKLGDVATYDKRNGKDSELPYVGMENISSESMQLVGNIEVPESTSSTFLFDNSHVLYGRLRPYLKKVLLPDFKGQCSTEVFCIKPTEKLLRGYLAYWLLSPKVASAIEKTSTGARMPRANMNAILDFELILPPLPEQQRIVAKLDAAFAEIDRAIDVAEYKYTEVEMLKAALLASALRGEDWKTVKLGEACTFISRGISPKYTEDSGVLVLNQKCIRNHSIDYSLARRHDIEKKGVKSERFVQKGDVLINSTGQGTLGRVAQVREEPPEPTTVDSHVTIVRPNLEKFYLDYFGYALIQIEEALKQSGQGTSGQTELSRTRVQKEFFASYPSDKREQQRIVTKLDAAFSEIDKSAESISRAKANYLALKFAILAQELQPPESKAA